MHKFKVEFSKNAFYHNKQHKLFKVHVNEEKLFMSVKNFKIKLSHLELSFIKCNLPWHVTATFMQSKRWIEKGVETKNTLLYEYQKFWLLSKHRGSNICHILNKFLLFYVAKRIPKSNEQFLQYSLALKWHWNDV